MSLAVVPVVAAAGITTRPASRIKPNCIAAVLAVTTMWTPILVVTR